MTTSEVKTPKYKVMYFFKKQGKNKYVNCMHFVMKLLYKAVFTLAYYIFYILVYIY